MISKIQLGVRSIQNMVGLVDHNVVYFEGGLGSQILSMMDFWDEIEVAKSRGREPKCDISYFRNNQVQTLENGLSIWRWRLDRFGIDISDLYPYLVSPSKFPLRTRFIEGNAPNLRADIDWSNRQRRYSSRFPIDCAAAEEFLNREFQLSAESKFASIHLRRGDYLKVATHVVEDKTYFALLGRIEPFLPNNVLFFSDSPILESFKSTVIAILGERRIYFHDGKEMDEGTVHDIMRLSSLLVTGNSTFSFTAGLLASEKCLVFAPMKYYGGKFGDGQSKHFRDASDFSLFR